MRVCEIEGCDKKHRAKGLCENHYGQNYRRTHPEFRKRAVERAMAWGKANPERYKAAMKKRSAEWAQNNKHKRVINQQRRRAKMNGGRDELHLFTHSDHCFYCKRLLYHKDDTPDNNSQEAAPASNDREKAK